MGKFLYRTDGSGSIAAADQNYFGQGEHNGISTHSPALVTFIRRM